MKEILVTAPGVLAELTKELVRRGHEEYLKDEKSQTSACLLLAIRSCSLLCGIAKLLAPQTRDSGKVLMRSFLETRDLLMTFDFDHRGTRERIGYWNAGKADNSWKADHTKCEELLKRIGYSGADFAKNWSKTTTLYHPTKYAAQNQVACTTLWVSVPPRHEDFYTAMEPEVADYLTAIATLIVIATIDLPRFIPLDCDPQPNAEHRHFPGECPYRSRTHYSTRTGQSDCHQRATAPGHRNADIFDVDHAHRDFVLASYQPVCCLPGYESGLNLILSNFTCLGLIVWVGRGGRIPGVSSWLRPVPKQIFHPRMEKG